MHDPNSGGGEAAASNDKGRSLRLRAAARQLRLVRSFASRILRVSRSTFVAVVLLGACGDEATPPPKIDAVVPSSIPSWQSTAAQLKGEGFYSVARVDLSSSDSPRVDRGWKVAIDQSLLPSASVVAIEPTTIEIVVPAGLNLGFHAVTVTSPDGRSDTLSKAFEVFACTKSCGDKVCCSGAWEDTCLCPEDCGVETCGNSVCCAPKENSANCPKDCASVCGNAICESAETPTSCPSDCPPTCPDGACNGMETPCTCAADCSPPTCGDGNCCPAAAETTCSCPKDCGLDLCGNGSCCAASETASSCPADCSCGNAVCDPGETLASCPEDCQAKCPDGACNGSETPCTCPADCSPPKCGDGNCCPSAAETPCSCGQDCGPESCGNGSCCAVSETASSCPGDCVCGNTTCDPGETPCTCPGDCPPPSCADAGVTLVCDSTDPDLVACFRFESSTQPGLDESQYGNNAVSVGVSAIPGFDGNALHVDATSSMGIAETPNLDVAKLTMELWFRMDALPTGTRSGLFDNDQQYGLFVMKSGALSCTAGPGSALTTALVSPMVWTHAACTYDGVQLIIYIDGVERASVSAPGVIVTSGAVGSAIGLNSPFGDSFVGLIDNLRVWRVARSGQQICESARACVP